MEEIKEREVMKRSDRWRAIFATIQGFLVTWAIFVFVFKRWHGFDDAGRIFAVVLVNTLAIVPPTAFLMKVKKNRQFTLTDMAVWAYMSLLASVMLFAR
jgi:uncharacterized membrane protein